MRNKKIPIRKSGGIFPKLNALRSELTLTQKSGGLFSRMMLFFSVLTKNNKTAYKNESNDNYANYIKAVHFYFPPIKTPHTKQDSVTKRPVSNLYIEKPVGETHCPSTTIARNIFPTSKISLLKLSFCVFVNSISNLCINKRLCQLVPVRSQKSFGLFSRMLFFFPVMDGELMGAFKVGFPLDFINNNKYHNHNNCTKGHENSKWNLSHFYNTSFLLKNIARIRQNKNTQKITIRENGWNFRKKSLAKPAIRIILEKSKSVFAKFPFCLSSNMFEFIKKWKKLSSHLAKEVMPMKQIWNVERSRCRKPFMAAAYCVSSCRIYPA
ncbi:MAG: hypothetical protein CVU78_06045 [Elusimicrobia bacterium HGW-Elusimicrobia-2]|nr:MAG: hypothetical protein CVU78_06045 [Elusimicrobia bacterium HGW-Elusimicrobia-2]